MEVKNHIRPFLKYKLIEPQYVQDYQNDKNSLQDSQYLISNNELMDSANKKKSFTTTFEEIKERK